MMKKTKIFATLTAFLLTASLFAGCAQTPAKTPEEQKPAVKTEMKIAALKGPTGMGMAKLMEDNAAGKAANNYTVTLAGAPDEITAKLISGELDAASVPTNLAATLYQKTEGKIEILANNTLGVLYIMSADANVKSIADLKGKTIMASGQGSTAEYVLNFILAKNGLEVGKDVTVEYKGEHSELAALAVSGNADIVMLPEPFVTNVGLKSDRFATKIDLTVEWEKVAGGSPLVMGSLVVRKDFLDQNETAVASFLDDYKSSVDFVNGNVEDASALIEKYDIMAAAVAKKAIPTCNIVFKTGAEMKSATEQFLAVMFEANPKSVGAKLPDENFYYQK